MGAGFGYPGYGYGYGYGHGCGMDIGEAMIMTQLMNNKNNNTMNHYPMNQYPAPYQQPYPSPPGYGYGKCGDMSRFFGIHFATSMKLFNFF